MAQETLDAEIADRTSKSDRTFVLKRVVNAPVSVVYNAWTDEKQLARWFGPHHFTNPICEVDLRVGGTFRLVMRSPEGMDYPITGVFTEIVPNKKLVYIENWEGHGEEWLGMLRALSGEENPSNEAVQTVLFEAQNGKTLITIQTEFATAAVCRAMSNMGMTEGWTGSFERLEGLAVTNASENEIVITRTFDAPRELVYKTFTDTKKIDLWWGPRGFRNETHERDVRVGGKWRYIMHGPDGTDYDNLVQYTELESPRYIAYLHGTPEKPDMFHAEISLEEQGTKTLVTLRMTFISREVRDQMIAEVGAIEGGNQTLDRLDTQLFKTLRIEVVSDTEVVLKRGFVAPRELVFEAMSKGEHFPNWWGPRSMKMISCTHDSKPGGAYQFALQDTNGNESRWKGSILELDGPGRMVFTESFDLPGMGWTPETIITVTLQDFWGMTLYTAHMKYASKEMRDGHLGSGFEEGASESYDRLQELTEVLANR